MSGVIQCFLLDPTDQLEESLRRYRGQDDHCSGPLGYHNASACIGRVAMPLDSSSGRGGDDHDHADPRWPRTCICGYVFDPADHWQHNLIRLFRRSDTGALVTLEDAPAGAMWYAPWYEPHLKGPDGRCLVLKTPGGEWIIDSPSSNSKTPWTRSGTPPRVTASPSIGIGRGPNGGYEYHGWLRDGRLEEC